MLLGILLMAIWLIATGVLPFTKGRLPHSDTVMNVFAIVAGVLILLGRYRSRLQPARDPHRGRCSGALHLGWRRPR